MRQFPAAVLPPWLPILAVLLVVPGKSPAQTDESHDVEIVTRQEVGPYRPEHSPDLARVRELIVEQTNAFRAEQGQGELTGNEQLNTAAQEFARYMADTDRYGHQADGRTAAQRISAADYEYCQVAENIAYAFATTGYPTEELTEQFVVGWKNSPGHRRNMLKPHVTATGTGVAQSEKTGVYYAVQLFGRPRSAAITFTISNEAGQAAEYQLGDRTFSLPPRYRREHQMCLPAELSLADRDDSQPVQPAAGDTFAITLKDEMLQLARTSE